MQTDTFSIYHWDSLYTTHVWGDDSTHSYVELAEVDDEYPIVYFNMGALGIFLCLILLYMFLIVKK